MSVVDAALVDGRRSEVQLRGGTSNAGLVVRVGDTVRRPQTLGRPAVHALLRHLERVGFDGAPRYLRQDSSGREVLTYVEGVVPVVPHPDWALTDAALVSVVALLRRYHDAVGTFDGAGRSWPTRVPAPYRGSLVCHNDPNLDNVVFRDGEAVAFIDFDLASPGSAVWDLALVARLWVPLRDPREIADARADRLMARLRLVADAYGLPARQRARLADAIGRTHAWCYDIVRAGAAEGQRGYQQYWTAAAQAHDVRGRRWLCAHADELRRALL